MTHTIHHVTAITAQLERNEHFYTQTLGLRLIKRTVNQDDTSAYHLFYADAVGSPGTDFTFFDWPSSRGSVPGPGTVSLVYFHAPGASLEWWFDRLDQAGTHPELGETDQGTAGITFSDPEGQRLAILDGSELPSEVAPWDREVSAERALRGIVGVDIESARPAGTIKVLTDVLGFHQDVRNGAGFTAESDSAYARVRIIHAQGKSMGRVGAGGVHHVAFRIADDDEMLRLKEKIEGLGIHTSGLVDRFYFRSLYFREPGGVLFELATDGPGFQLEESSQEDGQHLSLPPSLEPRRAEIEAGLAKPLRCPPPSSQSYV